MLDYIALIQPKLTHKYERYFGPTEQHTCSFKPLAEEFPYVVLNLYYSWPKKRHFKLEHVLCFEETADMLCLF